MKTKKAVLLTIVSVAVLSTAAFAAAGEGRRGPDRDFGGPGFGMPEPGKMIERMADRLDLDEAQHESLTNIVSAAKPQIDALREKARANRKALRALDATDPEVQTIAISNGELATEGTLLFTQIRSDINAVLTDEQRAKLAEAKENRKERGERRKKNRR